jgi:hypothetical protein
MSYNYTIEVFERNKRASLFNTDGKESYSGKSFVASAVEKQVEKRAFCDFVIHWLLMKQDGKRGKDCSWPGSEAQCFSSGKTF